MSGRPGTPTVHSAFSALQTCRWLLSRLLGVVLLLGSHVAWGESYQAQDENLQRFFTALSVPLGLPVVVSRQAAAMQVSGTFDFDAPQQVLEALAEQQGLIWHSDGQVLYLYDAAEVRSSAVALRHISVDRLQTLMQRTGMDEPRYPLRKSGERTFYVSGPSSYVDQVLRLAQLMDRKRVGARVQAPSIGVVKVFNADVADRRQRTGADEISVPGIASLIEARLSREQKAQLANGSLALIAYPDTNSLLVKGTPAQVRLIRQWVAELDVLKRPDAVALWQAGARDGLDLAPSALTAEQHARVQRAFMRPERAISP